MPEWIDARVDQRPPTEPPKGGSVFFFRFGSWFHIIGIGLMTGKMKAPIHVEDLGYFSFNSTTTKARVKKERIVVLATIAAVCST